MTPRAKTTYFSQTIAAQSLNLKLEPLRYFLWRPFWFYDTYWTSPHSPELEPCVSSNCSSGVENFTFTHTHGTERNGGSRLERCFIHGGLSRTDWPKRWTLRIHLRRYLPTCKWCCPPLKLCARFSHQDDNEPRWASLQAGRALCAALI